VLFLEDLPTCASEHDMFGLGQMGVGSRLGTGGGAPPLLVPADRNFAWSPGRTSKGGEAGAGIPVRNTINATLSPSGGDDTTLIQNALNACPAGAVVKLNAGTFLINQTQTPLFITTGITLRGSGPGSTIIRKNTGAALPRTGGLVQGTTINIPATQPTLDNAPIILVGPGRFAGVDNGNQNSSAPNSTKNLTVDGVAGATSITVSDASVFTVGRFVLIDEKANSAYGPTPRGFFDNHNAGTEGTVQVLTSERVVWNIHAPTQTFQDDPVDAFGWFSRPDPVNVASSAYTDGRVTCEIKEIASIAGNVITFTSPLAISYRVSHVAQVTRYTNTPATGNSVHLQDAGVEDLTVDRSGGGGIFFNCAAYCWAKNVEVADSHGLGISFVNSFRCEMRTCNIHTCSDPTPAADAYAVCLMNGSSEILVEDNIMRDYCKVIVARACGAGSVVAYNYMDDGWDWYGTGNATTDGDYARFQECGANASHMAGPHHVLFEGNYSFNADSDYTHGSAIYMTHFRNWYSGKRKNFGAEDGARCGGGATFSWWHSFVGNVLGRSGQMAGWVYVDARMGCDGAGSNCVGAPTSGWDPNNTLWGTNSIWKVGYDPERWSCNPDSQTLTTLIRDGNWDWLTSSQRWHNTAARALPNSMYLAAKPAFFGVNPWPWVDPTTGATATLPAKARAGA
jgi:hypothetical protein